ncbi:DNA-binding protein [Clostridia bacterium]|nr:DNA-binding protein [Clostridia bacterium]
MSAVKAFLDTNIFVYLYTDSDADKCQQALDAISRCSRTVSTQVLNEFSSVCIRKMKLPVATVKAAVSEICATCALDTVDEDTVMEALGLHEKYGYSYYDCLILASALSSGCEVVFSEDMADGQVIEGSLTIKNIFAPEKA